ncbi:MAG: two-component regulator propeller domain-containing protein, partial [Calditrichaceae bacterium]
INYRNRNYFINSPYRIKIYLLFIFLYSIITYSFAQPEILRFKHITTDDGLSQSTIYCIIKSRDGYMWFGTADGLNRYDGYEFVIYKNDKDDSTSISGNK